MPYITHHDAWAGYLDRHPDWYRGVFNPVCHAWGKIEEYTFYLHCEEQAHQADVYGWIIILGDFLKWLFKTIYTNVYETRYIAVYDDGALKACKFFENLEGQVNAVLGEITNEVNAAKAYVQNNLINPINDYVNNTIAPALADAQSRIDSAISQLSGFDTRIQGLSGSIDSMQNSINSFGTTLQNYETKLKDLTDKAVTLDSLMTDAQNAIRDLQNRVKSLEASQFKIPQISDIFKRG